jgi:hypothetical protein
LGGTDSVRGRECLLRRRERREMDRKKRKYLHDDGRENGQQQLFLKVARMLV